MKLHLSRRQGYTLIELLTVMAIVAALAAISVTIAKSSVGDSYRSVGGADRVSGWLLLAKNRALRDKTPVGVRLIRDPSNPNLIREAQYVEMPTLWSPNLESDARVLFNKVNPPAPFLVVKYDQGVGGLRQEDNIQNVNSNFGVFVFGINLTAYDVRVGDLLRMVETNTLHRIETIQQLNTVPAWYAGLTPAAASFPVASRFFFKLTLAASTVQCRSGERYPPSPPNPQKLLPRGTGAAPGAGGADIYPIGYPAIGAANYLKTYYFAFHRSARPILGEPLLTLPTNMVVDATPSQATTPGTRNPSTGFTNLNNTATDIDIIFAPNGQVLFTDSGMIALLVRNETKQAATPFLEVSAPSGGITFYDRNRMLAAGEMLYVAVYSKTGAVATYPVFMSAPAPTTNQYQAGESPTKFARDAFNRGL